MWQFNGGGRLCLAVMIVFVFGACGWAGGFSSPWAEDDDGGLMGPVARTLESEIGSEDDEVPATQVAPATAVPPLIATGVPELEQGQTILSLEDRLTALYLQTNPSVVFVLVSRSGGQYPTSLGSGSGFVYSVDGMIVTNHHVVADGDRFEIVFWNGDRLRAKLVGSDPDSDLAVLKAESLPDGAGPLPLADISSLAVGQFVIAIGNPFGEQGSMSLGIISGLGRSLPSQRTTTTGSTYSLPQVIQTDAPINPGNSGGPLLNLNGEVIGVNAAIATLSGSNSGVGFSIPVDVVKRVIPILIEEGEVTYAYMGVSFDGEITLDDQELYGVNQTRGAYVISVVPGSPADQAGLIAASAQTGRGGDLIIAIDGRDIRDFGELNSYLVLETEVGQTIELTVLRGDQTLVLSLTLGVRP